MTKKGNIQSYVQKIDLIYFIIPQDHQQGWYSHRNHRCHPLSLLATKQHDECFRCGWRLPIQGERLVDIEWSKRHFHNYPAQQATLVTDQ